MSNRSSEFKLIKAKRLIDGKGGSPLDRGAILIQGNEIISVGTEESVVAPEGSDVQEFDYGNKTVLPGLVDCHVHLNGIGDGRIGNELTLLPDEVLTLQAAKNARTHLYSGVTTVRDCGAKNQTTFMLRKAIDMGITVGPRLVLAGRPMAIIGGHLSYFGIQATGADECRASVRQLLKEGADYIKITATGGSTVTSFPTHPSFNVEELKAICDEIHKFGRHAAAHCASTQGMINVLDAGIDTIVHGTHQNSDGTYNYRQDVAERIAKQGVFVNPTFHVGIEEIKSIERKAESNTLTELDRQALDRFKISHETRLDHFARMRDDGVIMVCGSDSAWGHYTMGGFQYEIQDHVIGGMSPMEAIVSATSDSAKSCHVDDKVGSLEAGKQADILVVDGDPSDDITTLSNVTDVFLDGTLVDRGNYI